MAVTVIQPTTPEPTFSETATAFLNDYGLILVIGFLGIIIIGLVIYIIKKFKDFRKSEFLKDYERTIKLAKEQADKKRIQRWSIVTYVIGLFISGFVGIGLIALQGLLGLFMALVTVPTILAFTVIIEVLFKPFTKGDKVIIRFYNHEGVYEEKILGQYRGSVYSNDGSYYIAIQNKRKFVILPNIICVRIPRNPSEKYERSKIDYSNVLSFTEHAIYINFVASLEQNRENHFYDCVFIDKTGRLIDNRIQYFDVDKSRALTQELFNVTEDFGKTLKNSIIMNSEVQFRRNIDSEVIDDLPKRRRNSEEIE